MNDMAPTVSKSDDKVYVRGQIASLMEALTRVMFGDFTAVARTREPDEDFGYLCVMINVAINAARNAHDELRRANEQLSEANERLKETVVKQKRAEGEIRRFGQRLERLVDQRTAELREANRQLEAANRDLEAFSYSVSHDLRAPLRAIDGFSRLLVDEYADDVPSEARRYLGVVSHNAQQMGALIDGLLTFSRLGQQQLSRRRVDVDALTREVVAELGAESDGRSVEFSIGALPSAQADRMLLRQVVFNLLSNALKYTREMAAARIEIGCDERDGTSVYFVRDNGVGFDMRYADKLFQVFQRLHRAEDYEGTGLGLALVARIIERHDGRIWAQAKPGEGAAFYFTLSEGEP
jgi:light-regulated signal transduction histidine kinase (bacteriophytochrome)